MEESFRQSAPLADQMRPKALDDVIGQSHLLGQGSILRKAADSGKLPSIILWGPPGCGKTTIARILSILVAANYHELSAVSSGKADVMRIIAQAEAAQRLGEHSVMFLDEIHRFNKAQQDALLPHVEKGTITLIGATTENPSFEVIPALLSRTTVLKLNPVSKADLVQLLRKASKTHYKGRTLRADAAEMLADLSMGDARTALGGLETSMSLGSKVITTKVVGQAMQQASIRHDKGGESHYNLASALIKSMRGSQTEPALYYLHRLIEGGEDPKFIARRIVIFASEDIGMASPHALTLAVSAFSAVEKIGMPESNYILSQAVIAMCTAKKSRDVADQMYQAKGLVKKYPNAETPLHLRNAVTGLMKDFGYGKDYQWQADFKHKEGFWPTEIQG